MEEKNFTANIKHEDTTIEAEMDGETSGIWFDIEESIKDEKDSIDENTKKTISGNATTIGTRTSLKNYLDIITTRIKKDYTNANDHNSNLDELNNNLSMTEEYISENKDDYNNKKTQITNQILELYQTVVNNNTYLKSYINDFKMPELYEGALQILENIKSQDETVKDLENFINYYFDTYNTNIDNLYNNLEALCKPEITTSANYINMLGEDITEDESFVNLIKLFGLIDTSIISDDRENVKNLLENSVQS